MRLHRVLLSAAQPRVCCVQGASRGIGLQLARNLAARGDVVLATCRSPDTASDLHALQASHPSSVAIMQLDVSKPESIEAAAKDMISHPLVTRQGSSPPGLDLLLNTSGVLQDKALGLVPERGLARIDAAAVATSFAVNALGPLLVMQHLSPLLRKAAAQKTGLLPGSPGSVAVFYSARVGSIGDNQSGGWYSYRGSKAALNQFVRCMSHELRRHNVCCLALHPGTVDTELTRAFSQARAKYTVQDVSEAADKHLSIVDSLTMEDSGQFLDWKREGIAW